MCEVIEAENVLVTYFATHKERRISVRRLKTLRTLIEKVVDEPVYVDITRSSLVKAVELNQGLIDWEGSFLLWLLNTPKRADSSKIEETYNWRIPARIRSQFERVVATS
jgi:hypothetical protein